MQIAPGQVLQHRYRLERALGEGGMGTSFLARDLVRDVGVTVKILRRSAPALFAALRDEFARLRGLHHPHLCRVQDFGVARDAKGARLAFYTADYVDGTTLDRFAAGRSFREVEAPLGHALAALGFLHRMGLRHGDVKPENILVDRRGNGVLIDLGCSQPLAESGHVVSGTPGFVAPEVLAGGAVDARADLFAVGITLRRLSDATMDVPEHARELADRLCLRSPSERPGDVREVLEALGIAAAPQPILEARRVEVLGRRAEMARFHEALEALLAKQPGPRAIVISGPAGIGRSRLLTEMKWAAELRGDVVEGHARGGEAVASMLRRAAGGAALPAGVSGVIAAREALVARGEPVVLLLDDADAIEEPERALWHALIRSVAPDDPILVLGAEASPPSDPPEGALHLPLAPLGLDEVRAWIEGALPRERAAALWRLTGGYPASIEALLKLVWCGDVGEDELEAIAGQGSLSARRLEALALLGPEEASALGLVAALDGAMDDEDARALAIDGAAVNRLVQRGWLTPDGAGMRLLRMGEAAQVLGALPASRRTELHAIAAERLRARLGSLSGARASAAAARLVAHLCLAGVPDAAEAALHEQRALAEMHPDAWREAARVLSVATDRPAAVLAAAEIHEAAGHPAEALSLLSRLLRARPKADVRRDVRLAAAAAYVKAGDSKRALATLARILAGDLDPARRARALDLQSRAHIRRGHWAEAANAAREGLRVVTAADVEADLHDDVGVAASYLGDAQTAHDHLERASALHEAAGRPRARARSATYRALADYRAGDAEAAARGFRRALAIAEACGATDLLANAALNLGTACHQLGDLGEALRSYERGLGIARALGRASTEATLRYNLAKLFVDIGAASRAAEAAARAEARALELGLALLAGAARAVAGEAALLDGDVDEAVTRFRAARAMLAEVAAAREVAEADLQIAEACLALGDVAGAGEALDAATSAADRLGAEDLRARVRLVRGRHAIAEDRWPSGLDDLEEGARLARAAGQRSLAAEIEARMADACHSRGAEVRARRHDLAACELWERSAATLPPHLVESFWAHPRRAGRREALRPAPAEGAPARERKLRRLLDINKKLSASLDATQILAWTVDSALELTGAERGFVVLAPAPDAVGELSIAVARNVHPSAAASPDLAFSRDIAARVIAAGEPVITVDAQGDNRFSGSASVHAMRLKSVLCVPIRAAEGVLGALYLDHRFQRGLFEGADTELLLGFADQVAIALTNARLHEELARRTRELDAERRRIEDLLRGKVEQIDRLTEEVRARQAALELRYEHGTIVGRSAPMQAIFRTLDRVMDTTATVLLQGESGTGKELVARAIHYNGPRQKGPFVPINCGALPESLLEAELFGYRKGAFTGAHRDREGLLVTARGGTLFLDELGEMPPAMQVKLLRVLQEREVQPLGATVTVSIDVRIVCATNRRLRDEVAAGRFREDLYYRVGVVEITLPPLRDRVDDIPELAARILDDAARSFGRPAPRIAPAAMRALLAHGWPGNVRQLQNVLTKAVLMAERGTIDAADLDLPRAAVAAPALPASRAAFREAEEDRVLAVLRACRWNVTEACKTLDMPRATLYRRLKEYGVSRDGDETKRRKRR
ncbi:Response regulator of zinc sigma-54-dependent two-component system [Minicystis rosea]|nr:Response regulator of zinc sigma-54-dependent two-component system [Minicystis rosea]